MGDIGVQSSAEELTLRTLEKGLTVLEELASAGRQGFTITELGRRLGLHRSTMHRFLTTLIKRGYVEQVDGTDCFRLGFKTLELTSALIGSLSLRDVGAPILEDLARATRETVHIVVLHDGEVVTIDRIEAEYPVTLRTQIGARRPAHCTATGKAMLAFLPNEVVDEILSRGMPALAARTITDPLVFKAQLQEVRLRGYALDDEEFADGIRCAAAPVFDFTGRVTGAISLSAPCMRVDMTRLLQLAMSVQAAAHRLSRQLGYRAGGR
jgi:IclR family KDG regulon transcriptional repressor